MRFERLDGKCSTIVLNVRSNGDLLVKATWAGIDEPKTNTTVLRPDYFQRKYGVVPPVRVAMTKFFSSAVTLPPKTSRDALRTTGAPAFSKPPHGGSTITEVERDLG